MKTKEQIEAKIARSKKRVETRNAWKESRRALQGAKMLISKEEAEAREKAGKKPIVPKKWKEEKRKLLLESKKQLKVEPKDFHSEELKARRKAKRERLKAIRRKMEIDYIPQAIRYPAISKIGKKQAAAQAKFNIMIINIKQLKAKAKKQSKEDKAKHKASLVAFKETYVRTYKVQENYMLDADKKHNRKKNRGFAQKSTAKMYQMKKARLAA